MKILNRIERSRSFLEVLQDTNGDTYYSKSFKEEVAKDDTEKKWLKSLLKNDFASIQFMSQLPQLGEFVPHFYSGEKEIPSFIMTDVGPGKQLDEILQGGDPALAERALISLMKTLATIHKETIGKETQFLTIRKSLGDYKQKAEGIHKLPDFINFLERVSSKLNIDFESRLIEKELGEIFDVVFKPSKLLGLTHWDPCPDNCKLVNDTVKLYDFEKGTYSNVLIDGLYLSLRFPSCWCFADIPQTIIDKAEKEYRSILGQKVPEINDDSYFTKQRTIIMTFWFLRSIYYNLEKSFKEDSTWGIATMRQRTLFRLELTIKNLKELNVFSGLLHLLDKLNAEISKEWGKGDIQVKMYNAFIENR